MRSPQLPTHTDGPRVQVARGVPPIVGHKDGLAWVKNAVRDALRAREPPIHLAAVLALPVRGPRQLGIGHVP
eukprot:3457144-Prymnesium_polylepis.2